MSATLAQLVGANAKRLRNDAGLTLDKVATKGRSYGPGWTDSSIAAIERGDFRPTLQTLVLLAQTLSELTHLPVRLSDFLEGPEDVQISDPLVIKTVALKEMLSGAPVQMWAEDDAERSRATDESAAHLSVRRAARRLRVDVTELDRRSHARWGTAFLEERDSRTPSDARPQQVGAITRTMLAELVEQDMPIG